MRGQRYELVQFHFHHPAEERINGQSFPMVIHMVHRSAAGELAVVALLVEVGEANPIVNHLWSRLPFLPGQTSQLASNLFSLTDLLPNDKSYFVFTGSLTTPPCTENVLWLVMQQPITLSTAQVATFGQVYPLNSRPLQPVNNRLIQASQPVNAVAASF
ncbi:MAG: carbonic anhydrase family protein [Limnobacter sp.]|nr:carbonic anhydrase family protein [Limnobacter sp.]